MTGEADCRQRLYDAAGTADLILIEGVMGLFDGTPSNADLAEKFGVPVLAVIDACAMAQTFAAIAHGLASLRPTVPFYGVLANRVAGERHADMLVQSLPATLHCFGAIPREQNVCLPDRHLGLVQADEIGDLDARLEAAAAMIGKSGLTALPPAIEFGAASAAPLPQWLAGMRIAVARDAAFAFLYPANLELLAGMGARLSFFSPLADTGLPPADAVYLPGGYPELHLERLAGNRAMHDALRVHAQAGKSIYAECGGMLYLLESLAGMEGDGMAMAGILPGSARTQTRLAALGLQAATLPGGVLRGHTFHYSRMQTPLAPVAHAQRAAGAAGATGGEAIYRHASVLASYLHFYFPSNPEAAARLFLP